MSKTRNLGTIKIISANSGTLYSIVRTPDFDTTVDARKYMKKNLEDGQYAIIRLVEEYEVKTEMVRKTKLIPRHEDEIDMNGVIVDQDDDDDNGECYISNITFANEIIEDVEENENVV
tara:strand:+ start:5090 stop:5443 length:354 start_codon:yes stop_codon:yes gene_type:complete